ncbi:MAG: diaminopimelate decarboxylase [Sutterellaceae bacterium]|nr:diaminopimelate decarboxylase [Sutterellaceae bacterium]
MLEQNFTHTGFCRKDGALLCESLPVVDLARQYGTPLYVYSHAALKARIDDWAAGVAGTSNRVFYAMKANANLAILHLFAQAGFGFDIVSAGELARALAAGAKGENIVYSGVGKTVEDIKAALLAQVHCFNVESVAELDRINEVAGEMGAVAPISLRVNPDVDAKTHPYISTGLKNNKFGVAFDIAVDVYKKAQALPNVRITGIDCHIGSQITELEPFVHAADKLLDLVEALKREGIELDHIDFGGGLGVRYAEETPPTAKELIAAVSERVAARGFSGLSLYFEPGRSLVADAGALVMTVQYLKPTAAKNFCIVDAGMNDMIRPTLYQAVMPLINAANCPDAPMTWDVVGPICETGDFLSKNETLSVRQGDVLVMLAAGAYGMSMASNYNARGRAAEVLVKDNRSWLVRRRETPADIMALETTVPEL